MQDAGPTAQKWISPRLAVCVLALVIVLIVVAYCGQLVTPYLEHDDWNFLLPESWGKGYATPAQKTLTEGRWLNYWWYLLIGVRWSATAAAWCFTLASAAFACVVSWRSRRRLSQLLLALLVFFSPTLAELSTWPAALAASRVLLALTAFALLLGGRRGQPLALFLGTLLAVMAYSGIAPVILLTYVFLRRVASVRGFALAVAVYLAAYALAILAIATLNDFNYNHFGVVIEGWRHPHPADDLASFAANVWLQLTYLHRAGAHLFWPVVVWLFAVGAVAWRGERRLLAALLAVAGMAWAMDTGMAALNGVLVPVRSMGWLWVAMAFTVGLATEMAGARRACIGYACAIALLAMGLQHWAGVYRVDRPAGNYIHAVGATLARQAAGRDVVLVGKVPSVPVLRRLVEDPQTNLRMAWAASFGLVSRSCSGTECAALVACARELDRMKLIFPCRGVEVVYFRPGAVFP